MLGAGGVALAEVAVKGEFDGECVMGLALGKDASEADTAVLDAQQQHQERLTDEELAFMVTIDTSGDPDLEALRERLRALGLAL